MRPRQFRGRAAYIGKVDTDDLGQVFGHDMRAVGVTFRGGGIEHGTPTGRCVIVVTPDAERTMNTCLGVSSLLNVDDLDETVIADATVLYMEGYLYDRPDAKKAFRRAAEVAHANERIVSLTLSDSFCVERHRDDFRSLVRDNVDLLFGNHDELIALYQTATFDEAIAATRAECALAAITVGADGCVIVTESEVIHVPAEPVDVGDRHDRGRRPLRRRIPPRPHDGARSLLLRSSRVDRRGGSDQPRRSPTAGGVAYARPRWLTITAIRTTRFSPPPATGCRSSPIQTSRWNWPT